MNVYFRCVSWKKTIQGNTELADIKMEQLNFIAFNKMTNRIINFVTIYLSLAVLMLKFDGKLTVSYLTAHI